MNDGIIGQFATTDTLITTNFIHVDDQFATVNA